MKPSIILALIGLAGEAVAFPAIMKAYMAESFDKQARSASPPPVKRVLGVNPGFNAAAQHVSTEGPHAFIAPGPGDARGPCPGLNAMANHNYIPHNGVATIQQFISGTYDVFGMGTDLGAFLAIYGAVLDGDGTSWSIGGPSAALPGTLGGLLGTPQGISQSHNKYESDVSPTRGDLFEYGNDYLLQLAQFNSLYSKPLGPSGYDLSVLTPFRAQRFQESIANNPYFFNGPFTGVIVQPAAYTFIYRFMGNKSAEYPEGYLNGEVLKNFFSITGSPGNFKYTPGYERIPYNWYKRAVGDDYTIQFFQLDLVAAALEYPQFLSVGGNTGTTNSFAGVDISSLNGGIFNTATLLQGNNLACFGFQSLQQLEPDLLKGLYNSLTGALPNAEAQLTSAITNAQVSLGGCPQLAKYDTSQFAKYPGYTKLHSNGDY